MNGRNPQLMFYFLFQIWKDNSEEENDNSSISDASRGNGDDKFSNLLDTCKNKDFQIDTVRLK